MNIPFHPLLIHFPIGFIFAALILHSIYLLKPIWACRIGSIWLTGFGAIFSLLASISGQLEYNKALTMDYSPEVLEVLANHQKMGNVFTWALILFTLLWINFFFKKMNDKRVDVLAFIILFMLTIGVIITSYLGGTLVWEYGVGIKKTI